MKIKTNHSKGIHQRNVTQVSSSSNQQPPPPSTVTSASTVNRNDFEMKRRNIVDDEFDWDGDEDRKNNFNQPDSQSSDNHFKYSPSSSSSTLYHGETSSRVTTGSKHSASTSDTLIGFIPLILLIAILSCFVFGVFTIIKLAVNHAYKDDYD